MDTSGDLDRLNSVNYTVVYETVTNYPDMTSFDWGETATGAVYSIEIAFDKSYTPVALTDSGTLKVSVDLIYNKITVKIKARLQMISQTYNWIVAQQTIRTARLLFIWSKNRCITFKLKAHETSEVYPETAVVTSTVYNNKVIFASRDFPMYSYDGFKFEQITAASDWDQLRRVVQRRLAAAEPGRRTIIDFSRRYRRCIHTRRRCKCCASDTGF